MKRHLVAAFCASTFVLAPSLSSAQTPPRIPKTDSSEKAAEAAEKAAKRAKTAESAAKASKAAERASKADNAQKASTKAESAQKAADKAAVAQKSASKAESAQKAAQSAEKAAGVATTAQKSSAQSVPKIAVKPVAPLEIKKPTQPREPGTGPKISTTETATSNQKVTTQGPGTGKAAAAPSPGSLGKLSTTTKTVGAATAVTLDPKRQGAADAANDNPIREPGGGPNPGIAGPDKGGSARKGEEIAAGALPATGANRSETLEAAAESLTGTTAASGVDSRLNEDKTKRPKFDQGFGDSPAVTQADADALPSGNPVRDLTGGSVLQGPLADSANQGDGVTGIADQGTGSVSSPASDAAKQKRFINETTKKLDLTTAGAFSDATAHVGGTKGKGNLVIERDEDTGAQSVVTKFPDGSAIRPGKNGQLQITNPSQNGTSLVIDVAKNGAIVKAERKDNVSGRVVETIVAEKPKPAPKGGGVGTPADDTPPLEFDLINTDTVAEQIRQSKLPPGGGTTDPVPSDGTSGGRVTGPVGVKGDLPQDDQIRNLAGTPGAPGVVNESGGNKGTDTFDLSRGVGGTRPTDDSPVNTQGIREDPADFVGDGVGPTGLEGAPNRTTDSGTPPATITGPDTTLAKPLPEEKTPVRAAGAIPLTPLDAQNSGSQAEPVKFDAGKPSSSLKPDLRLANPLPAEKTALSRTIGPVSGVNSGGTSNLSTGGASDSTTASGSLTASSGDTTSTGIPEEKQSSPPPVSDNTDPAAKAGELFGGNPTPAPTPPAQARPGETFTTPRGPSGSVVTPIATPDRTVSEAKPTPFDKTLIPQTTSKFPTEIKPAVSGTFKP